MWQATYLTRSRNQKALKSRQMRPFCEALSDSSPQLQRRRRRLPHEFRASRYECAASIRARRVGQQVDPQGAELPLTLRRDCYLRVTEGTRNSAVAQRLNYLA